MAEAVRRFTSRGPDKGIEKVCAVQIGSGSADDMKKMMSSAQSACDFMKALANENRLLLLCLLSQGEKSVTELENTLQLRQPTVSQQLARLRADNLVSARRDGKTIYYSLASEKAREMMGVIYKHFCATK